MLNPGGSVNHNFFANYSLHDKNCIYQVSEIFIFVMLSHKLVVNLEKHIHHG